MPRGQARRTGDVGGFRIQWGAVAHIIALALAAGGLYARIVVLEKEVAMLTKASEKLESKVDSMQSNLTSFERYLQDMSQQMQRRTR